MSNPVRLRPAMLTDARRVWEWRNEPETRAASFDTAPIAYGSHVRWFEKKLHDPDVRLLIAVDAAGAEIGYARLDRAGDSAEISLGLDRARRGRGMGSAVISAAAAVAQTELGVLRLVARVKVDNARSISVFQRAGFAVVTAREVAGMAAVELACDTGRRRARPGSAAPEDR